MSALQFGTIFGGTILGTVGLNAGANALLRKGLGSTLSYTPGMVAGGVASTTFLATLLFEKSIKALFSENQYEKQSLIQFGLTLLTGGIVTKLLYSEVTKTQACAFSALSFVTSHLATAAVFPLLEEVTPITVITRFFKDYVNAGMWFVGMGK